MAWCPVPSRKSNLTPAQELSCPLTLACSPLQSKGGILSKACDYIRELRQTNQRMQETFKEAERLQMDNELLRQQVGADLEPTGSPRMPRLAPGSCVLCGACRLRS